MVFILQWNNATNEEPCSTEPNVCIGYYVILCRFCVFQFLSRAFTCEKFYTIYFVCILVCVCMHGNRPGSVYGTMGGGGEKIWALSIKTSYESTLLNVICRNEFPEFRVPFDFMCHFVGCWVLEFLSISFVQPNHKHYVYDNCVICCSFDFTCQLFLSLDVEDFAQLARQQQWQPGRERQRRRQHLISFYRIQPPELPNSQSHQMKQMFYVT